MKRKIYILLTIVTLLVVFCYNLSVGESGSSAFTNAADNGNQSMYNPPFVTSPQSGGWQLQVMPNMGNRLVRDLYFTDSLTGYAVASPDIVTDSAHILKTTNGGNNWIIKGTYSGRLPRIIFLNAQTGFAGGNYLLKTTNAGENWMVWNWPLGFVINDMQVFSEDTIWFASSLLIGGGAFRTTNGGLNWEKRDSGIPANSFPDKIYFYNSWIGFAYQVGDASGFKTTNGGSNWFPTDSGFIDIHFLDSLNGWRSWNSNGIQKTTNGGLNWIEISFPNVPGVIITNKQILKFNIVNVDTMFAVGGYVQRLDFSYRAIIYKTTNMGLNWIYLYPDTGFVMIRLTALYTINNNVWAYSQYNNKGIYSAIGGGTTNINSISAENPKDFELFQNYPNPFNATTKIRFDVSSSPLVPLQRGIAVKLIVYDIMGKEIQTLVNERLNTGTYETTFDGSALASGIYFYQLFTDGIAVQTRKMILLK